MKTFSDAKIIASFCPFVYLNLSSGGFFGQFEIIDLAPGSRSLTPYIYTRCQQVSIMYPDPLDHRGIPAVIDGDQAIFCIPDFAVYFDVAVDLGFAAIAP